MDLMDKIDKFGLDFSPVKVQQERQKALVSLGIVKEDTMNVKQTAQIRERVAAICDELIGLFCGRVAHGRT